MMMIAERAADLIRGLAFKSPDTDQAKFDSIA
jgi:hypothetical protein